MAWKWPWKKSDSGGAPVASGCVELLQAHLADLRQQLAIQQRLAHNLVQQLAERDAQIRLVLEEQFYRPVPAKGTEQRPAVVDPEEFNDVTQFDAGSDEEWLKKQDRLIEATQRKQGGNG